MMKNFKDQEKCSVCCGNGVPLSGLKCVCGGSGLAIDETHGLRLEIYNLRKQLSRLTVRLHYVISPLNSAAGDISNILDGTVEPSRERLIRIQDAIDKAVMAMRREDEEAIG